MRIVLSYQSDLPIYEQIKEQIKADIISGELAENEPLPSIRRLARELEVSVITTTRAYSDLELEGFINTVPGKGCYVKKLDVNFIRQQYLNLTKSTLKTAIQQSKTAGLTIEDVHNLIDEMDNDHDS